MGDTGPAPGGAVALGTTVALSLESALGHLLRRAQQRHTALWTAHFAGVLTGPQYAVLSVLGSGGELSQRAIGTAASLDRSTTADVLARLERHGWVTRAVDAEDVRRNVVVLTAPAREALDGLTGRAAAVQDRLLQTVPSAHRRRLVSHLASVAYAGKVPTERSVDGLLALPSTPGHLLRRAEQLHGVFWADLVDAPLTPPQFALLRAVDVRPGSSQSEACALASLDRSSGADVVLRLSRRGLLDLERDARDARRKILHLSTGGARLLGSITPAVSSVEERLLVPLRQADDRDALLAGLRAIARLDTAEPA